MHTSRETPEQTRSRLLKVIACAEFLTLEGTYAFEELPASELLRRVRADALALVRDEEMWSQLVPCRDVSKELCRIFGFHFVEGLDNSGLVGWLATQLKEKLGTGVLVICGQNSNRGGIFDYWGCPAQLGAQAQGVVESLMSQGKAADFCPGKR